jgi:sensor histidine kinase YesM
MSIATLKSRYSALSERALLSLSDVEKRDVQAFDRWFYREKGWRWVIVIFSATTTFAAVAAQFPWNMTFLEAAFIFNALVFALLWSALGAWFGYRKLHDRRFRLVLIVVGVTLAGALIGGTAADFYQGREPMSWLTDSAKLRHMVTAALAFGFLYVTLVALIANLRSREYAAQMARLEAERRQSDLSRELAESKLRMLQLQIEPHFLFNTLGSAQQLAEKGAPDAARLIADLIRFLRASTPSMRGDVTTLGEEGSLIGAYLAIMKTRLSTRLSYAIDIPDALRPLTIPPGMLITLAENAIKHGIEPDPQGGTITMSARRTDHTLVVTVADTGVGLTSDAKAGQGIGLSNIRQRLALLFGDKAELVLEENEPRGFVARLSFPIE